MAWAVHGVSAEIAELASSLVSLFKRVLASLSFSQSLPHRGFSRGAVRGDFGGLRLTPYFGMLLRMLL